MEGGKLAMLGIIIVRCNSESPLISNNNNFKGAKGDWDFRISDLVKIPDGIDI